MDDLKFGKRDKRGDWRPNQPIETAPLFVLPPRLMAILKWLPHYFFPWNAIFAASAVAYWAWVIPPIETMQTISIGWIAWLYAVNAICVFFFYGAFELQLYVLKRQENRFKYNGKFPSEAEEQGVLVRTPEPRQHSTHVPVGRDDLDGDRGRDALGLCEWICAVAQLRGKSVDARLCSRSWCRLSTSSTSSAFTGSSISRFSTNGCIPSTTIRSILRPGPRCRCIRSSICSTSERRSTI